MDFVSVLIVALLVGVIVGMTGMGGGALMTPALIFLGVPPTVSVTNDLVASAFSRSAGAITHWKRGSPNKKLVLWLVIGSIPSAFAGGFIINSTGTSAEQDAFVKLAIGVALILAAITYTLRVFMSSYKNPRLDKTRLEPKIRPLPTLFIGVVGGLLVGLTSVGAGSIIMVALLILYPTMRATNLVGTDLVQAVPLVIAAAVGHVITDGIDWSVLVPLIIGSVPGTILGAQLAGKVKQKVVRRSIVVVLLLSSLAMLGVPTIITLFVALLALIFGPVILNFPLEMKKRRNIDSSDSF